MYKYKRVMVFMSERNSLTLSNCLPFEAYNNIKTGHKHAHVCNDVHVYV